MNQIKVNPLPSRTWRWLRMNDSTLEFERSLNSCFLSVTGNESLYTEHSTPYRKGLESGMGEQFDAAMTGADALLLRSESNAGASQTAVIRCGGGAGVLHLHAEQGSVLPVIVLLSGNDAQTTLQIRVHAEIDAKIQLYLVQLLDNGLCATDVCGVCETRGGLELVQLNLGAERQFAGIAVELLGEESYIHSDFGYRVTDQQKLDINYVARHKGRNTVSTMNAWAVMEEGAWKLFRGTIDFQTGCAGAKGAEKEEVLLMGSNQVNQTIPLILCTEEDVEGDHGATISRLDEQVLFYLASRGIDAKTAEDMVARARLEAICAMIPNEEIRSMAEHMIQPDGEGVLLND